MIMIRAKLALAFVAALAVTSAQHAGVFGARNVVSLSRNLEEDVCVAESAACGNSTVCENCYSSGNETALEAQVATFDTKCSVSSFRTFLGGAYMTTAACKKEAATQGSALDRMLDCTAATVDPICDDLYSMARCKVQTDACTADGLCASCTSEADPDTSELHGSCNATANDANLRAQFNTTCTASGTLLDKAITCIAGAFAKDCKGVANSSGTLKIGAAALSAVLGLAASLLL